jgi:transposase
MLGCARPGADRTAALSRFGGDVLRPSAALPRVCWCREPVDLLAGFAGYLQSDGFEVYAAIAAACPDIRPIGCFAHARRKFDEALETQGKIAKTGKAQMGLAFIQRRSRVEQQLKAADPAERLRQRHRQARPILQELHAWPERSLREVPPSIRTGKALAYLHHPWPKLLGYLADGRLSIDNTACERAIRPFAIGRRNWLFADTPNGARASAYLYSLIETAKANGHEPYRYRHFLFTQLPGASTPEEIAALLPLSLAPDAVPQP